MEKQNQVCLEKGRRKSVLLTDLFTLIHKLNMTKYIFFTLWSILFCSSQLTAQNAPRFLIYEDGYTDVYETKNFQGGDKRVSWGVLPPGADVHSFSVLGASTDIVGLNVFVDGKNWMDSYLGQMIRLGNGTDVIEGTVEEIKGNQVLLKTADGYSFIQNVSDYRIDSELRPSIQPRQSRIELILKGDRRQSFFNVDATYLLKGLRWSAQHTVIVDEKLGKASIASDLEISNQTGVDLPPADLSLVSGFSQRSNRPPQPRSVQFKAMNDEVLAAGDFLDFGDQYVFPIGEKSLKAGQTHRMLWQKREGQSIRKQYVFALNNANVQNRPAQVVYRFMNGDKILPGGVTSVYVREGKERVFQGQQRIQLTPKGKVVELTVAQAPDVRLDARTTKRERPSTGRRLETLVFEVENSSDSSADISLRYHVFGDWSVKESSVKWEKSSADEIRFESSLSAGEKRELVLTLLFNE